MMTLGRTRLGRVTAGVVTLAVIGVGLNVLTPASSAAVIGEGYLDVAEAAPAPAPPGSLHVSGWAVCVAVCAVDIYARLRERPNQGSRWGALPPRALGLI